MDDWRSVRACGSRCVSPFRLGPQSANLTISLPSPAARLARALFLRLLSSVRRGAPCVNWHQDLSAIHVYTACIPHRQEDFDDRHSARTLS